MRNARMSCSLPASSRFAFRAARLPARMSTPVPCRRSGTLRRMRILEAPAPRSPNGAFLTEILAGRSSPLHPPLQPVAFAPVAAASPRSAVRGIAAWNFPLPSRTRILRFRSLPAIRATPRPRGCCRFPAQNGLPPRAALLSALSRQSFRVWFAAAPWKLVPLAHSADELDPAGNNLSIRRSAPATSPPAPSIRSGDSLPILPRCPHGSTRETESSPASADLFEKHRFRRPPAALRRLPVEKSSPADAKAPPQPATNRFRFSFPKGTSP